MINIEDRELLLKAAGCGSARTIEFPMLVSQDGELDVLLTPEDLSNHLLENQRAAFYSRSGQLIAPEVAEVPLWQIVEAVALPHSRAERAIRDHRRRIADHIGKVLAGRA